MTSIMATTTTEEEKESRHVELGKGEVPYLSEDASNLFIFMNLAIIILYLLYNQYPVDHQLYPFLFLLHYFFM